MKIKECTKQQHIQIKKKREIFIEAQQQQHSIDQHLTYGYFFHSSKTVFLSVNRYISIKTVYFSVAWAHTETFLTWLFLILNLIEGLAESWPYFFSFSPFGLNVCYIKSVPLQAAILILNRIQNTQIRILCCT